MQNLLRQSLYYNFDYYHERGEGAFQNPDDILRFHVCKSLTSPQVAGSILKKADATQHIV